VEQTDTDWLVYLPYLPKGLKNERGR
jgi:hypothetical protein